MSEGRFRTDPGEEVVDGPLGMDSVVGRIARNDVQVGGREVPISTFKSAFGERGALNDGRRNRRRQSKDMGVAIYGHAIQGEEIVPHVASVDVHGGRTVGSCRYARQPLRPPDRVPFAHRRNNPSEHIGTAFQFVDGAHDAPGVRLDRRAQRVGPTCFLRQGEPGQEQGEEGNQPEGIFHHCSTSGWSPTPRWHHKS